jgi:hypothetical protein
MWTISGTITTATVAVLAGPGLSGIPGEWFGLAVDCVFASVSFALGFYE